MRPSAALPLAVAACALCLYALLPDARGRHSRNSVRSGPPSPRLALTFDDGPHPEVTPAVLDALAAAGATATFFMVGANARRWPGLVRRVVAEGHALGVHTDTHRHAWLTSPAGLRAEIARCTETLTTTGGARPLWFRPPWGAFNAATVPTAAAAGLRIALWSCDAGDWLPATSGPAIRARVLAGCHPGAIIDLHDGGRTPAGCRAMAAELPGILEEIRARGLHATHLGALFDLPAVGPAPDRPGPAAAGIAG